ncbi:hypothetical protein EJ08DRAFT_652583 [Tothia fuscella]|uniref:Uncharacterized protein n=1 Tax=Tothia fuscella TaxID=1048955 RepID=A0A9P4NJT3_9PEZI|nr:hypothetical protein EJ08DRAFT_652583 [Tothia fuscella]
MAPVNRLSMFISNLLVSMKSVNIITMAFAMILAMVTFVSAAPSADKAIAKAGLKPVARDAAGVQDCPPFLGVSIDICHDTFFNNCERNLHLGPCHCHDLEDSAWSGPAGISSIGFTGSTNCVIYSEHGCRGDQYSMGGQQVYFDNGWNDRTRSLACFRRN